MWSWLSAPDDHDDHYSPVNLDIIWSHNYENYNNPDDHDVSCTHDHCYHCDPDNYGLSLCWWISLCSLLKWYFIWE